MDEALLAAACAGKPQAINDLLTQLRPIVVRYCRARLGGHLHRMADADDCAQDILLAVFAALPRYQPGSGAFIGFVFSIAAHKVADIYRRRGKDHSGPFGDLSDWNLIDPAASPHDHAERAENARHVHALLGQLSNRAREVLVLRIAVGLSAEATADAVGLSSAGAVRVVQHRALNQLRRIQDRQTNLAAPVRHSAATATPSESDHRTRSASQPKHRRTG